MWRADFIGGALLALAFVLAPALAIPAPCRAAQLRLAVDGRDGAFDGMSHSGVALTIRNHGPVCMLSPLAPVTLRDARGRRIEPSRATIGDGASRAPLTLPHDAIASAALRWVAGPVYPDNVLVRVREVSIRIGARQVLRVPLKALIYGQRGMPITFTRTPFQPGPGDW